MKVGKRYYPSTIPLGLRKRVQERVTDSDREVPYIRISGKWLNEYGLSIGTNYTIKKQNKRITIEVNNGKND